MPSHTISYEKVHPWWGVNDLHLHRWKCGRPSNEPSSWSKANKVCPNVTPSLCVMGERRGLWQSWLQWFLFFLWFPNGVYEFDDFPMLPSGVWVYYIVSEWGRLYWFGFGVQSKWERSSRIGLRGVLNGTELKYSYSQYGCEWVWVHGPSYKV